MRNSVFVCGGKFRECSELCLQSKSSNLPLSLEQTYPAF